MPRRGNKQRDKKLGTNNKTGVKKGPPKQKPQKNNPVPRHTVADLLEEFRNIIGDNAFLATNVLMEVFHDFSDHKQFGAFLNYNNTDRKVWGTGRQPYKEQALIALLFLVVPEGNDNYGSVGRLSEILSDPSTSWTDVLSATDGLDGVGRIAKIFLGDGQYRSKVHAAEDEAGLFLTLDTQFQGEFRKDKYDDKSTEITNWFERTANDLGLEPVPMKDGQMRRMLWCIADILPPLNTPARDAASPPVTYYIDPSLVSFFDPGVGHSSKTLSKGQARVRELHPQTLNFHTPAPRSLTIMQTTDGALDLPFVGEYRVALYSINTGEKLDEHVLPSSSFQGVPNPNQISQVMGAIREAYQLGDTGDFDPSKCIVDEEGSARYLIFFRRKALGDSCQSHYCDVLFSKPVAVDVEPPDMWNTDWGFVASKGEQGAYSLYSGTDFGGNSVGPEAPAGFNPLVADAQEWDSLRFNPSAGSVFFTVDLLSGALGSLHTCSVTCINTHKRIIQVSSQEGAQKEIRIQEQITRDVGRYLGMVIKGLNSCGIPTRELRGIISASRRNPRRVLIATAAATAGLWLGTGGEGGEEGDTDDSSDQASEKDAEVETADAAEVAAEGVDDPSQVPTNQFGDSSGDEAGLSLVRDVIPSGEMSDPGSAMSLTDRTPGSTSSGDRTPPVLTSSGNRTPPDSTSSGDRTPPGTTSSRSTTPPPRPRNEADSSSADSRQTGPPQSLPVSVSVLDQESEPAEGMGSAQAGEKATSKSPPPETFGIGLERVTILAPAPGRSGKITVDTQHDSWTLSQKSKQGRWSSEEIETIERLLCRLYDIQQTGNYFLDGLADILGYLADSMETSDASTEPPCPPDLTEVIAEAIELAAKAEYYLGDIYVSLEEILEGSGSSSDEPPIGLAEYLIAIRDLVLGTASDDPPVGGRAKATRKKRQGGKARKTRRRQKRPKANHTRRRAHTRRPSKTRKDRK